MTTYPREPIVERIERDDRVTTVVLSGELDLSTIVELQHALEAECSSSPSRLVIDIAAVEFIDSAALHLFITMSNRLADGGGSLEIVQVPERLRRIFSITKLDALLLAEPLVDGPGRRRIPPPRRGPFHAGPFPSSHGRVMEEPWRANVAHQCSRAGDRARR